MTEKMAAHASDSLDRAMDSITVEKDMAQDVKVLPPLVAEVEIAALEKNVLAAARTYEPSPSPPLPCNCRYNTPLPTVAVDLQVK